MELLLKHRAGAGASRSRAGGNDASEQPSMRIHEDTAGKDEDEKEMTAGMLCSAALNPFWVIVHLLLQDAHYWNPREEVQERLKCSIIPRAPQMRSSECCSNTKHCTGL